MSAELRLQALDLALKACSMYGGDNRAVIQRAQQYYEWLSGRDVPTASEFTLASELHAPSGLSTDLDGA